MNNMIFNISLLRVSATIMIVLGHSFCVYGVWPHLGVGAPLIDAYKDFAVKLTQISLPLFFMISGFLFQLSLQKKPQKFKEVMVSKGKRVLIPYLAWGVFGFLIFHSIHDFDIKHLLIGIDHLWFLLALFWCFPLYWFIQKITKGKVSSLNIAIIASLFLSIISTKFTTYLCIDGAAYYLNFFLIGVWINRNIYRLKISKKYLSVVVLYFFIVLFYFHTNNYYEIDGSRILSVILYRIIILGFSTLSVISLYILSLFIQPKDDCLWCKQLSFLDKNSFGIYIIHHMIIYSIVLMLPSWIFSHYLIVPWAIFAITLPASLYITVSIKWTKLGFLLQ